MPEFRRIPPKNSDFNSFVVTIHPYLNTSPGGGEPTPFDRLDIPTEKQTLFNDRVAVWNPLWAKSINPLTQTPSIVHQLENERDLLEPIIRDIQNKAEVHDALTQDDREVLRIPKPDDERTRIEAPTVAPDITIETREHRNIKLRLHNPIDPDTKSKPDGVDGTDFYIHIGNNPPPTEEWLHAGTTGRFLFTIEFKEEDLGKTVHIVARYRNPRGEFGPFSDPVDAVIS